MNIEGRVKPNVERLKQLRREHGISQEGLADLCLAQTLRVSASSIKRAEAGKNLLYRTVRDLATFFSVDISELIESTTETQQPHVIIENRSFVFNAPKYKTYVIIDAVSSEHCQQIKEVLAHYDVLTYLSFGQYVAVARSSSLNHSFSGRWIEQLAMALLSSFDKKIKMVVKTYPNGLSHSSNSQQGEFRALFHEQLLTSVLPQIFNVLRWGEVGCDEGSALLFLQTFPESSLRLVQQDVSFFLIETLHTNTEIAAPHSSHIQQMHLLLEQTLATGMGEVCCLTGCHGIGKTTAGRQFLTGLRGRGINQIRFEENHLNKRDLDAKRKFLLTLLAITPQDLQAKGKDIVLEYAIPNNLRLVFMAWLGLTLSHAENSLLQETPLPLLVKLEHELFRRLIVEKLSKGPSVLFLDDLHSYSEEMLQLVVLLLNEVNSLPVFVILTFRNEGVLATPPSWLRGAHHIQFAKPLNPSLGHPLDGQVDTKEQLVTYHPLYEKEVRFGQQYNITIDMSGFIRTIQAYLLELSADEQHIFFLIVIFGGEATLEQLNFCIGRQVIEIDTLVNKGLCVQCQNTVYMGHSAFIDAVLPILTQEYKIELHRLCESWFKYCGEVRNQVEHLRHFDHHNAAVLLLEEAQTLGLLHQYEQALECIQQATQIDPQCQAASLQHSKGNWLYHLGHLKESIEAFQHAHYLTTDVSLQVRYLTAKLRTWGLRYDPRRVATSFDLKELAQFLEQDTPEQASICLLLGGYWFSQANFSEAAFYHKTALHFAELENEQVSLQQAYIGLGACAVAAGQMQTAEEYLRFSGWNNTCPEPNELDLIQWVLLESSHLYLLKFEEGISRAERFLVYSEHENNMPNEAAGRLLMAWFLLEERQWQKAETHIRRGIQLAEQLQSNVFQIFFIEAQMRFDWGVNSSVDQNMVDHAMELVEQHQFETLIGPWLCASVALYSSNQTEQMTYLRKGAYWLQQYVCIGHNTLRFCQQAIQVSWQNKDIKRLQHYTDLLSNFIQDEPVPWATCLLKQADAYILMIEKDTYVNNVSDISTFDNKDGFASSFLI